MSEYTLEDGRKAEKVENNPDPLTKVTELYVEPKLNKRLSQRVTEKFCVCEREIEMIDEETGEVVSKSVENLCSNGSTLSASKVDKSPMQMAVERKLSEKSGWEMYLFGAIVVVQLLALAYVLFFS
jgi:hypothetical protein